MNNNPNENFKDVLFGELKDINQALIDNKVLEEDQLYTLLLSSILEEEG